MWQCTGARDFAGVVAQGALCLAHPRHLISPGVHSEDTKASSEDTDFPMTSDDCIEDEFCPKCGSVLEKLGCFRCAACGYKSCL